MKYKHRWMSTYSSGEQITLGKVQKCSFYLKFFQSSFLHILEVCIIFKFCGSYVECRLKLYDRDNIFCFAFFKAKISCAEYDFYMLLYLYCFRSSACLPIRHHHFFCFFWSLSSDACSLMRERTQNDAAIRWRWTMYEMADSDVNDLENDKHVKEGRNPQISEEL